MPELPEVETVARGLASQIRGCHIQTVALHRSGLRYPFPAGFAQGLSGRRVRAVGRRAKYILVELDNQTSWVIHLGMSGKLLYSSEAAPPMDKHEHVRLTLEGGATLLYQDPRRFGAMELIATTDLPRHAWFAHLGPEPLQASADDIWPSISASRAPIKQRIMDAGVVVGVGNIYASEALFRAHIHPLTPSCALSRDQWDTLFDAIREVLEAAISSGGSTLRDYVRSSGDVGYFQHHFRVYGRDSKPCEQCHTPIAKLVQAGRSSFYCPTCQPKIS
jgi:formamidopyrimidine-DNA glycosylase